MTTATVNVRTLNRKITTPLIAAMRCYIARHLGEEVQVPDELA